MPTIEFTPEALVVRLSRGEKIWALHGDISVPWSQVSGAETLDRTFWRELGFRIPGTAIPPWYVAGTYIWRKDRAFVSWSRKRIPLQINLNGNRFSRIVVGVDDAEDWAERINYTLAGC